MSGFVSFLLLACLVYFFIIMPIELFFTSPTPEKYGYRWCDIKGYIKMIKEKRKKQWWLLF